MRKAIRQKGPRAAPVADSTMLQAPTKGWTADTSVVAAEKGTAIVLDNWFPEAQSVRVRRGYAAHATGVGGSVETLMPYRGAASMKLFAARDNGTIYDATAAGAASSSYSTSRTEGRYVHCMFATSGGQYLYCVNGADAPIHYNGSAWAVPSITGVTASTLGHVIPHQNRLFFLQEGSTDVWYLPTGSIAGAASALPIGGYLTRGGYLVAQGSWTLDAGSGVDDLYVVVSSEGEAVVFQGPDPDSADTWALQGIYQIGKPLGKNSVRKVGGDLVIITDTGAIPISIALKTDQAAAADKSISHRIRNAWNAAVKRTGDNDGWQIETFPRAQMALVNVPASGSYTVQQFVMNVTTGAWARFTGWEALCWAEYDGGLYFGAADGKVYAAETGGTDNGAVIQATMIPAYDPLKAPGRQKHVKMIRPVVESDIPEDAINVSVACSVDYEVAGFSSITASPDAGWFTWDVSNWDEAPWFGEMVTLDWRTGGGIGTAISPSMRVNLSTQSSGDEVTYSVIGFQVAYEVGSIV